MEIALIALNIGWVLIGLAGLYYGAEWLVRGSAGIALSAGLSTLIVGLTVVAFGTSMPELIVSIQANLKGNGDFALGNIIGSNICNIGLVLGVAAIMTPLVIQRQVIKREFPILVFVTFGFVIMLLADDQIGRIEGLILFLGVVAYTITSIRIARNDPEATVADLDELEELTEEAAKVPTLQNVGIILVGLIVLGIGSDRLVAGGEFLAVKLGVSQAVISLTLVAFGTSLPELATTVVACSKGESDLAAGNAIGSCLFNLLCVGGLTALIKPITSQTIATGDLIVVSAFAIAAFALIKWRAKLDRAGGIFLLVGYLVYTVFRGMGG